jgi:hypothetical protein
VSNVGNEAQSIFGSNQKLQIGDKQFIVSGNGLALRNVALISPVISRTTTVSPPASHAVSPVCRICGEHIIDAASGWRRVNAQRRHPATPLADID